MLKRQLMMARPAFSLAFKDIYLHCKKITSTELIKSDSLSMSDQIDAFQLNQKKAAEKAQLE